MDIAGLVVMITGAGSGIGRALARTFGEAGAIVIATGRRRDRLEETVTQVHHDGGTASAIAADVTAPDHVERLVEEIIDRYGQIDVLYNNAGSFAAIGAVWEVDPDVWWHDVTVNLRGTMLCCHAVLPHMRERGSGLVINMTGGSQIPGGTGYSASKVAVVRFTELLARELEQESAGVYAVVMGPGLVATEMSRYQVDTEAGRRWLPSSGEAISAGKDRPPEDCARAAVELVRSAGPAVNGQTFGPDSDFSAYSPA